MLEIIMSLLGFTGVMLCIGSVLYLFVMVARAEDELHTAQRRVAELEGALDMCVRSGKELLGTLPSATYGPCHLADGCNDAGAFVPVERLKNDVRLAAALRGEGESDE